MIKWYNMYIIDMKDKFRTLMICFIKKWKDYYCYFSEHNECNTYKPNWLFMVNFVLNMSWTVENVIKLYLVFVCLLHLCHASEFYWRFMNKFNARETLFFQSRITWIRFERKYMISDWYTKGTEIYGIRLTHEKVVLKQI